MDIGTGLALFGAAGLAKKILGPTADYLGKGIKEWVERRTENVKRIFAHAARRLGPKIEIPGAVSPRVLRGILDHGSFCDDELASEYFGGILASARTEDGRDDRGIIFTSVVADLSSYQICLHYVFYTLVRQLFVNSGLSVQEAVDTQRMRVYIPLDELACSMGFSCDESPWLLFARAASGLRRHDLVEVSVMTEAAFKSECRYFPGVRRGTTKPGPILRPTAFGSELYLWVHAHPKSAPQDITNRNLVIENPIEIEMPRGAIRAGFATAQRTDEEW